MEQRLILATDHGVEVYRRAGEGWQPSAAGLRDRQVTSVIAREGTILAGTRAGVFRSDDGGETWEEASKGLDIRYVRWLAYHPAISDREFAGTEPAGIFISYDGAATWRACPEVEALRDRYGWWLPYSPRAGCIRGFAFHGQRGYAAVETGGVLRSDDGGKTWRLTGGSGENPHNDDPPPPRIHPDVHSIEVHPSSPDLVFAPTGGGFYRSVDGGASWEPLYADCYARAVWLDPNDPDHLILGPASGVDRNGRIEETRDGGRSWHDASAGLDTPWRRHMVERFLQIGDELLAVLSNGRLIAAPLATLEWRPLLPEAQGVHAAAVLEV
ncbi:MAG: glycosyl hydrolase [Herpetosiphonaceae bacterium]|nr:MAG: glycosyl hydrolase [Herpetosiphonaceae bacterium]